MKCYKITILSTHSLIHSFRRNYRVGKTSVKWPVHGDGRWATISNNQNSKADAQTCECAFNGFQPPCCSNKGSPSYFNTVLLLWLVTSYTTVIFAMNASSTVIYKNNLHMVLVAGNQGHNLKADKDFTTLWMGKRWGHKEGVKEIFCPIFLKHVSC